MLDAIDPRAEEKMLVSQILAGQREPGMMALCKLLEIRLLRCQNEVVDCSIEEFPALQSAIKTYLKLIKELKPK